LNSPSPLISTLIVRLVLIFSVSKGELMTVWTSKARTSAVKVTEMITKTIAKAICIVAVPRGGADGQERG